MSGLDIGLALFILLGAYHGYKAGFLLELFSLFAVVLGVLLGFKLMGYAMLLLAGRIEVNEKVLPYIAFAAVFIVVVILVNLLGKLISASVNRTFLGGVDQAAGGIRLLRTLLQPSQFGLVDCYPYLRMFFNVVWLLWKPFHSQYFFYLFILIKAGLWHSQPGKRKVFVMWKKDMEQFCSYYMACSVH